MPHSWNRIVGKAGLVAGSDAAVRDSRSCSCAAMTLKIGSLSLPVAHAALACYWRDNSPRRGRPWCYALATKKNSPLLPKNYANSRASFVATYTCDLADADDIAKLFARIRREVGSVDVLINNAGIINVGPLETMTVEDYQQAMAVHFWAPLLCIEHVLPDMRRRGEGRIVNISSIGGDKLGVPHLVPYCASKFALNGLSQGMRAELAKDGVYVTTVCPGLMRDHETPERVFQKVSTGLNLRGSVSLAPCRLSL